MKATHTPEKDSGAGDLRVLIVEDSTLDAGLMVRELERSGYHVAWRRVETAADLTAALDREAWEVVLADFSLPRFSGLEAMKLVQGRAPDLPFLLVSGTMVEETAVAAMRAGASDYLLKDRLARLAPAVRRALQEADERRARRQAEDVLRRLYHAVEQCPAIIVITDLEGRIEYANPRFTAVSGYTFEEVRGQHSRILKSDRTMPAEYARLWKTVSAGGEWRGEFANRTKQGQLYWEAAAISPVRDATGRITHYVKVAEDITERKRVEESLRKLESQLRQAQKMEALGELAGGIAHDFNSFLGAAIVNAQVARAECAAGSAAAEHLDRVIAASRQAAGLARQMLNFSRREERVHRPLRLGPVVRDALRLLEATRPLRVRVEVDIPPSQRTVLADATQIQEAVINLWTNACHACHGAGGRIVVSLADVDVAASDVPSYELRSEVAETGSVPPGVPGEPRGRSLGIPPNSATRDAETADSALCPGLHAGPYVRLTVQDDGCGMSPEVQERIFEPFFSTKPAGQGTGLGMSVVQSIMLAHQGVIAIESRPQNGTAIHLWFPAQGAETAGAPGLPELPPEGRGQRILLVDDHALVRDGTRSLLEHLGYHVTVFGEPLQALAAFVEHPDEFDLVLTDLSMREMNGAELARKLLDTRPGIPIIVSSGYEMAGIAQHVRDLGIREVLSKPVQRDCLAAALARALARGSPAARGAHPQDAVRPDSTK